MITKSNVMKKPVLLFLALLPLQFAFANHYIIQFGNNNGYSYTPAEMQVNVGDTIIWKGDFSASSLSSLVVPTGAKDFKNGAEDIYTYVVRVAGEYDYESPDHFTNGMTGKFYATGINSLPVMDNSAPLYVVQEQGHYVLYSTLSTTTQTSDYRLNIYNMSGAMVVATTIDLTNSRIDLPHLAAGNYIVRVADSKNVLLAQQIDQP
jgi:plastocyanin